IGWAVAQIVRKVVTNLLAATGTDRVGVKFGLAATPGSKSLSWIIGTVVYVLVLIPVAITALNALQIEAISVPAINMLNDVLSILPRIFSAAVILVLAYVAGKYISELVTNILTSIGFDNVFEWLGLPNPRRSATPPGAQTIRTESGQPTILQSDTAFSPKNPSELVGLIVLVAIMLVATLAAVDILAIEALTALVEGIIVIAGKILSGVIVFAVGLFFANLAFRMISSTSRQSRIVAQAARIAIITLVSAMALQQIGVASNIVNLAFGLLLGAVAVAVALAFGLGSRDIAAEQLREWLDSFKRD
ncbi:MAG: mechanosensitive ion channel, partial [Okeania sp. SIO2D1]|nr:mechanosensitive ion channel [Okeania sp. SIO2D1]